MFLLDEAKQWEMRVDFGKRLVFSVVVHTNLRPDVVIWSQSGEKMILVELTVPWEEGLRRLVNEQRRPGIHMYCTEQR